MPEKISLKTTAAAMLLMALLALTGRAGTWVLANGDKLTSELVREGPDFVEISHPQLGRLKLARAALQPLPALPAEKIATTPTKDGHTEDDETVLPTPPDLKTAQKPEPKNWKRLAEVGYSQQSGAKEKQDLSVRLQVDGKEGDNTYRGTAKLLHAAADGLTVTERTEADFRWRHDINKRLFAQALTTYASDAVRKIDLSLEQQVGGGYRIIDNSHHKANVGLGAVVQYLERVDTEDQTALLGSFFQDYAYQLNRRVKLVQESNVMVSNSSKLGVKSGLANVPSDGSYRLRFNTGVQSKVTNAMSLNVRFEYDYDRSIVESELRADQRLTTSLGYVW